MGVKAWPPGTAFFLHTHAFFFPEKSNLIDGFKFSKPEKKMGKIGAILKIASCTYTAVAQHSIARYSKA